MTRWLLLVVLLAVATPAWAVDSYIQGPPDSSGKKTDTWQLTVGANTVHRVKMRICGVNDVDCTPVDPQAGMYVNLRRAADGQEIGTATNPLRIDPTGTTVSTIKGAGAVLGQDLAVRCVNAAGTAFESCAGAGGGGGADIRQQDKSAFVEGTGTAVVIGGVFNDTISADPGEDQFAAARVTAKRALHANLRSAAGVELGTAAVPLRIDPTGTTRQSVTGTGAVLGESLAIRCVTAANDAFESCGSVVMKGATAIIPTYTDLGGGAGGTDVVIGHVVTTRGYTYSVSGKDGGSGTGCPNCLAAVNDTLSIPGAGAGQICGELPTGLTGTIVFEAQMGAGAWTAASFLVEGALAPITTTSAYPVRGCFTRTGFTNYRARVTVGSAGGSLAVLGVSPGAPATLAPASYAPLPSDGTNQQLLDPCATVAKTTTPISQTTSTRYITAVAGKKNYICSLVLVAGAAEVVNVIEGTGTLCASAPTAAIVGSLTAAQGLSFAANGGLASIGGDRTAFAGSGTAVDTCLTQSGSNRVAGSITWVQR